MRSGSLDLHSLVKSSTRYRVSGRGFDVYTNRKLGGGTKTVLPLIRFRRTVTKEPTKADSVK